MHLDLNKEQYKSLLELLFLGEWLVNGVRNPNDFIEKYPELSSYIMSKAQSFGCTDMVEVCDGNYLLSDKVDQDELSSYIDHYNEHQLGEELLDQLVDRDMNAKFTKAEQDKMSDEELLRLQSEIRDMYEKELEQNGLKNFHLVPKKSN